MEKIYIWSFIRQATEGVMRCWWLFSSKEIILIRLGLLVVYVLRDKLELKAEKDGAKSYEALERKAALYDKLVQGELSIEEDEEKYCVDFFRKNLGLDESERPLGKDVPPNEEAETDDGDDLGLFDQKIIGPGRTVGMMDLDKDEHKRFVREVHEEVNQAREKVSELKMRRQRQVDARREKLRQAYLRKQLNKWKASTDTQPT